MNKETITPPLYKSDTKTIEVETITTESNFQDRLRPIREEINGKFDPVSHSANHDWRYNPQSIDDFYSKQTWQVIRRLFTILVPCTSFIFGLFWDKFTGKSIKTSVFRAAQVRKIITDLGPTYIKIGQALSTRPDLIPPVYLEELALLQDQIPPFPNELAYQFITEELGKVPTEIYAEITESPIAAASLGQVYKGRLKTGEEVAIKVQRPDLLQRITIDIYIVRKIAKWATNNVKRLRSDLVAILDEFAARIFEEMDYGHEGRNAERFADLYGHLPDIYVPKIYWEYTGRRVLTMEWITGIKMTDTKEIEAQGIDARYLIDVGVQCSLRQLLEHGFFHADPHPGNLLAMPDQRLAYLDFGMMSEVEPYQRYGLIQAIVHLVNRDFEALAQDYVKLEFLSPDTDLRPIVPALAGVFENALGASVAELNFKSITDQLSEIMYEFPFRVPAYYALIIRSLVTLEGIAIGIDPNFKVLSRAYPYVAKRLLTDTSPELRTSLQDLLFEEGSFRWNRLENLLRNANQSDDFDFDNILNQTLDFLFSERGTFIRERLIDEIVKSVDLFGRHTLYNMRQRVGLTSQDAPPESQDNAQTITHIQNIWSILGETSGFDANKVLPLLPKLLTKPETQQMGQKIASRLAQKVTARLLRNILVEQDTQKRTYQKARQSSRPTIILQPAAIVKKA